MEIGDLGEGFVERLLEKVEMADDWKTGERCGREVTELVKEMICDYV